MMQASVGLTLLAIAAMENGLPAATRLATTPTGGGPSPAIGKLVFESETIDNSPIGSVLAIRIMRDGALVVVDRSDNRLVAIDTRGHTARRYGRPGGGPGEYRQIVAITTTPDDTLVVYDPTQGHVVYAPNGRYVRTVGRSASYGSARAPFPVGWLDGGVGLAISELVRQRSEAEWTDSAAVVLVDATLKIIRRLAILPLAHRYRDFGSPVGVPFAPSLQGVTALGHVCFGYSAEAELRCVDHHSGTAWFVRDVRPRKPVTAELMAQYRRQSITQAAGPLAAVPQALLNQRRAAAERVVFPPTLPAYSAALADQGSGAVWLRDFDADAAMPGSSQYADRLIERWSVFGPRGELRGRLTLPAGFHLLDVRQGRLAGVRTDEGGAQAIQVYEVLGT